MLHPSDLSVPNFKLESGADGEGGSEMKYKRAESGIRRLEAENRVIVRGRPVFCSEDILESFQLRPQTPLAFFGLRPPPSSGDTSEYFLF